MSRGNKKAKQIVGLYIGGTGAVLMSLVWGALAVQAGHLIAPIITGLAGIASLAGGIVLISGATAMLLGDD